MTRENAIKTLKELWRETNDSWYEEVYNMAINALEADRKDEPQTDIHDLTDCDFCKDRNCKDCEGGKDEPQTEEPSFSAIDLGKGTITRYTDEPQTDCAWK